MERACRTLAEILPKHPRKLRLQKATPTRSIEKLVVFTEHRDTLSYLQGRFEVLGRPEAVVIIHREMGGRTG